MDSYNINNLSEGQYEWALKLVKILLPYIHEGIQSMLTESIRLCEETKETNKYLMTLQNFLARVPNWNPEIIQKECTRIIEKSGCTYIEDLISCVHISHLKILASIKPGKSQKKIDIEIPKMDRFVHKVYINCSREFYSNTYLFEKNISPLIYQKNRNEIQQIIKQSILDAIRDSIPIDTLLRSYLDESTDLIFTKEKEPEKEEPEKEEPFKHASIQFSDNDRLMSVDKQEEVKFASKDVNHLDELASIRHQQRKLEEESDEDEPLIISDETPSLDVLDISDLSPATFSDEPEVSIDDLLVNL
jgi:Family of unknown function (DUF5764)